MKIKYSNKCTVFITVLLITILISSHGHTAAVLIDHVSNSWDNSGTTVIEPECDNTFYFRVINDTPEDIDGMTHGFEVWTQGGTPFYPLVGDTIYEGFSGYFDLVHSISYYSNNGTGSDTIGFSFVKVFGPGLPAGFNDIVFSISTGGVENNETLCIDSVFFPPSGQWIWSDAVLGAFVPDWSGPYCYNAIYAPCLWPDFFSPPDTLLFPTNGEANYTFEFTDPCGGVNFNILEGPGEITSQGVWTYTPIQEDTDTWQTLTLLVHSGITCRGDTCSVELNFSGCDPTIDINQDCMSDIGDLVYLVNYMFGNGPEPPILEIADLNGDGEINISDLVYLVDYMFGNGPPPVN